MVPSIAVNMAIIGFGIWIIGLAHGSLRYGVRTPFEGMMMWHFVSSAILIITLLIMGGINISLRTLDTIFTDIGGLGVIAAVVIGYILIFYIEIGIGYFLLTDQKELG